jgi:RHS repeat-associated protein
MSLSIDGVSGNVTVNEENFSSVSFVNSGGSLQPPPRTLATLVKNADGTYTFKRKSQVSYIFNAAGKLIREVDRNNYATILAYDTSGRLSTVTDPAGRALTFNYGTNGLLANVADPISRSVSFVYDTCGQLTQSNDVGSNVTRFTYETSCDNPAGGSSRRMVTMRDPRNLAPITNTYDGQGRVTQQTDQLNRSTKFAYGGTVTITDAKGNVTVERYRDNLMFSQTKGYGTPQQATWTYTYDPITLGAASITDPNGHVATMRYDSRGNLVGATDPMGRSTSAAYNSFNDPTSSTDPLGVPGTVTYDTNGNLKTTSRPLQGSGQSATAVLTYDPANPGDVLQLTDANGKIWTRTYNQYGNPITVADPLGNKATYVYDTVGRLTSSVSPNGNVAGANPASFTTTYVYNVYGEVTSVTDPLNHQATFVYDANGNLQTVTDANLHATTYTYDAADQLTMITRTDNSTQSFSYDLNGNLTLVKDGLQQPTNFTYDPLDRKTSMTDALNRAISYTYDPAGRPSTVTDAMGRITSLAYNAAGELVAINYSDGITPNVTFAYDAMGRAVSMSDGSGTSTYGYDSLHRMGQATNGAGSAVGYGYDLNGHLTTVTYPGTGRVVTNTYDDAGRLASVRDWLNHSTTYKYDANSHLIEQDYPNGVIATFSYDNADRLTSLKDALGVSAFLNLTYGRDNLGQLTSENSKTFGYDTVNRMTSALIAGSQSTYAYDNADRLTQVQVAAGNTSTYAYDAASQLQSLTTTQGTMQVQKYTYTYDKNGNRASRTDQSAVSLSYYFDQADRLTGVGTTATYSYDGTGLRTQKNVGGTITPFTWNITGGLPTLLLEAQTAYVNGLGGLPLEQITSSGQVYYYHLDQLGSTRAMTDTSGTVVQTYDYDAYGNPAGSTGTITNPFRYAGQYTDAESGLQYLRARYYDPASQSFISRDPAVLLEPYSYAGGSPQSNSDPSGLDWRDGLSRLGGGARAVIDGFPGLASVPFLGTGLSLLAAYNALRHCDFAAASEYMSNVAMNLMTGVLLGGLGSLLGDVAKVGGRAAKNGEGAAERAIVRGEEKATNQAATCAINSFAAGTLVLMADGTKKPIEQIQPGDLVMAGDPQSGTQSPEPVEQVIVGHGLKQLYDISIAGDVVEATYNHPFWVVETGSFVWAKDLVPGEHVLLANGRAPPIKAISHRDEITTVYNLSIKDVHTFYVGSSSVLVHNQCKPTGQLHHLLSNPVMRALKGHPKLFKAFERNDSRFIYRAANAAAHRGYQTWHRVIDKDMVEWIQRNTTATRSDFIHKLQSIYDDPEIRWRIPGVHLTP